MRGLKTMEAEAVEFEDWEVLPMSDDTALVVDSSSTSASVVLYSAPTNFEVAEPEGVIVSDYFSLDNHCRYAKTVVQGDVTAVGSVDSDNPSWIDHRVVEDRYANKIPAELLSNASKELAFTEIVKSNVGLGEIEGGNIVSGELCFDSESKVSDLNSIHELGFLEKPKNVMGFEEHSEFGRWDKNSDRVLCDREIADGNCAKALGMLNDLDGGNQVQGGVEFGSEEHSLAVKEVKHNVKSRGEEEKMRIACWKVPFVVLKYCVYRVSPLWSFSVAAAFVGFIFLGRKFYKMNKKSPGLQLKVTMDDKPSIFLDVCLDDNEDIHWDKTFWFRACLDKVSQFASHAARLNEAFSVARRVPVPRLSLAIVARDSFLPMMSLR